jgi:putative cell wall-binding protein
VFRASGADRIETAIEISNATFAAANADDANAGDERQGPSSSRHDRRVTANAVVLARSTDFADALTGTPLAAEAGAPILLNPPGGLDARVLAVIQRISAAGGTVHLPGERMRCDPRSSEHWQPPATTLSASPGRRDSKQPWRSRRC